MNARRASPQVSSETRTLKAMLMHEDVPTCLRAWHVLDLLAQRLEERRLAVRFTASVCDFNNLATTTSRAQALADASDLELFVLAAHGRAELPAHVKTWLEEWAGQIEARSCAVVVSLDSRAGYAPLTFVRQTLRDHNVEIFPHWADALLGPWDWHLDPVQADAQIARPWAEGLAHRYETIHR